MFDELRGRKVRAINAADFRKFAVMVPLLERGGEIHVLFEKRSMSLRRQPGEICFPGGARDGHESPEKNAIRETAEELMLPEESVEIIARMDTLYTVYNNEVSVFLCQLHDYAMTFSGGEVEEVFTVPLDFFLENEPEEYRVAIREVPEADFPFQRIPGGRDYYWREGSRSVYFYQYEGRTIWGLTACIMRSVAGILRSEARLPL